MLLHNRHQNPPRIVAAVLAIVVVTTAIFAVVKLTHRPEEKPTPGTSTPAKPVGPLDGTFTAEFGPKTELVGEPYEGSLISEPYDGTWSIRSACRANGCVATASLVNRQNSASSMLVFDDIDGRWVAVTVRSGECENIATDVLGSFHAAAPP